MMFSFCEVLQMVGWPYRGGWESGEDQSYTTKTLGYFVYIEW